MISLLCLAALAASSVAAQSSISHATPTYSTIEPNTKQIAAAAATATAASYVGDKYVEGKVFNRLIHIWLENTDYKNAATSELSMLAKDGILLTNYVAVTHPSEPNYLAAVAGDYFGLDNDRFIQVPANISSVADLLEFEGISWSEYQEDLPYTGFQGFNYSNQETFANDYVRKHNPLILFENITSSDRISNIKNFTLFYDDLNKKALPQWSFITPNMTNDAHDTDVQVAGNWAYNFLTPLLNNSYFMNDTLIVLTFDENDNYEERNNAYTILLGGAVPSHLKGTTDDTFYSHYSLISSAENNWGLHHLGRHDLGANVFSFMTNTTGFKNFASNDTVNFWNQSYTGIYNDVGSSWPCPDTSSSGAGGKGVLPVIKSIWGNCTSNYSSSNTDGYVSGGNSSSSPSSSSSSSTSTSKASSSTSSSASGSSSARSFASAGAGSGIASSLSSVFLTASVVIGAYLL
jgi:acid phosphatase